MIRLIYISILLLVPYSILGQSGIRNKGKFKVFDGGGMGIHTNLVNDGSFSDNEGLVGLYTEDAIRIYGSQAPVFMDLEIAAQNDVIIQVPLHVMNNLNFIEGNIRTQKEKRDVSVYFGPYAFYTGTSDYTKVNGVVGKDAIENFIFPVGTQHRLRPLEILINGMAPAMNCTYYDESPDKKGTDGDQFNSDSKSDDFLLISTREYWRLEGSMPVRVRMGWDLQSNTHDLAEYPSDLVVVGWHRDRAQWEQLGNTGVEGNMSEGFISSSEFIPDDYAAITLGGKGSNASYSVIDLGNYYLTPNGDGMNDALKIEALETMGKNSIQIFNRYGVLVYQKDDYRNEFQGKSNMSNAIKKEEGLEAGVYFYLVTFHDLQQKHQGYLYLSQ